jgi:hypothetical protein
MHGGELSWSLCRHAGSAVPLPDWSSIAGGSGSWAHGRLLRHSADVRLSNLTLDNHTSGWPAVWLRWPRAVTVSNCQVGSWLT